MERFRSNGKLLLTAEYFILDGATAYVLPLRLGQELNVVKIENPKEYVITWKAFQDEQEWFHASFSIPELAILESSDPGKAEQLAIILREVHALNPSFFEQKASWICRTALEFDRAWGLGSSSTLIANLAAWAKIDPMQLVFAVSRGSGYDVAAATRIRPFLYTRNVESFVVKPAKLSPKITPSLYFVYTGRKQDSRSAIAEYKQLKKPAKKQLFRISEISEKLATVDDPELFGELIKEHEDILSHHLHRTSVQKLLFPDFSGTVKSLGAWGGDFLLFLHTGKRGELEDYLFEKGLKTYFTCMDLIYN